jgi:hypothetical protein
LTSLPGAPARRSLDGHANADVSVFAANAANYPWRSHAQWFLQQLAHIGSGVNCGAVANIFRPELYAEAARLVGMSVRLRAMSGCAVGCRLGLRD